MLPLHQKAGARPTYINTQPQEGPVAYQPPAQRNLGGANPIGAGKSDANSQLTKSKWSDKSIGN